MSHFTQLGISGKPEGNSHKFSTPDKSNPIKESDQKKTIAFVSTVVAATLAGLFLLQSGGCSTEKGPTAIARPSQAPLNPPPTPVVTTAVSPLPQPSAPVARKVVKKPVTVAYAASGLSFSYPKRYVLKTPDLTKQDAPSLAAFSMNFVQPGGVTLATVEIPKGSYRGTDLASAAFSVSMNKNLTQEQCEQFALLQPDVEGKPSIVPARLKLSGMDLRTMEAISGPETEQADTKYYHVYQNGACYEFGLGLSTSIDAQADSVNPVDRTEVFRRLQRILATVKINSEPAPVPVMSAETPVAPTPAAPPVPPTAEQKPMEDKPTANAPAAEGQSPSAGPTAEQKPLGNEADKHN